MVLCTALKHFLLAADAVLTCDDTTLSTLLRLTDERRRARGFWVRVQYRGSDSSFIWNRQFDLTQSLMFNLCTEIARDKIGSMKASEYYLRHAERVESLVECAPKISRPPGFVTNRRTRRERRPAPHSPPMACGAKAADAILGNLGDKQMSPPAQPVISPLPTRAPTLVQVASSQRRTRRLLLVPRETMARRRGWRPPAALRGARVPLPALPCPQQRRRRWQ